MPSLPSWLRPRKTRPPVPTARHARRRPAKARLLVELLEGRRLPSVDLSSVGVWQERGPGPIAGGDVNVGGSLFQNPVAGAVEALAPHPTNRNVLYAGTVGGGVWKTNDAYDHDPFWVPLTDQFPSLSIGALAFSPMDPTSNTLFAGIGRTSNNFRVGGPLTGLLKTTDGGASWKQVGAGLGGLNVESVVPTTLGSDAAHQVVLAAGHGWGGYVPADKGGAGVYRSTDGGLTFTLVVPGVATQLAADPGQPGVLYAGVAGQGIFRTADGGATWTLIRNGLGDVGKSVRVELAVYGDATHDFVFAAVVGADKRLAGVYRSGDQGASWVVMGDSGFGDPNPPDVNEGAQGGINLSLAVNPADFNDVYVAGDGAKDHFVVADVSGELSSVSEWDGDWDQITGVTDTPHPDSRDMVFDAAGQLLESDDGGIYRHADRDHWDAVTGNLRATEILSVGYDAQNGRLIAGFQDNGLAEELTSLTGQTFWSSAFEGGDGGSVGVGYVTGNGTATVRYGTGNNLTQGGLHYEVFGPGEVRFQEDESELNPLDPVDSKYDGFNVFPLAVNAFDGNRILLGAHSLYESTNKGDGLTTLLAGTPASDVFNLSAVVSGGTFHGTPNPDLVYAGFSNAVGRDGTNRLYIRTSPGGVLRLASSTPPPVFISRIALDPDDWHNLYVTDGTTIEYSDDAGQTWTPIPAPPGAGRINAIDVVSPTTAPGDETLVVGADAGVFRCLDPHGKPAWREVGLNLPNAPVSDLHYIPAGTTQTAGAFDDVLVVGTLGRGAWVLPHAASLVTGQAVLSVSGDATGTGRSDQFSVQLDANNPAMVNVILNGATVAAAPVDALDRVAVQGLGGDDTLTVDFSNGDALPAGGLDFDGGSGNDTLTLVGALLASYTPGADGSPDNGILSTGFGSVRFTGTEFVPPVAPKITGAQTSASVINEGDTLTVAGTFTDPGSLASHTVSVDAGGRVVTVNLPVGARSFSVPVQGFDEGLVSSLPVTVTDNDGKTATSATASFIVLDVPVVARGLSAQAVRGATDTLPVATFTDPGGPEVKILIPGAGSNPPVQQIDYSASVDWGDGTGTRGAITVADGVFTVGSAGHVYRTNGTYATTVTINHDGLITTVKGTVTVSSVGHYGKTLVVGTQTAGDFLNNSIRVVPVTKTSTGLTTSVEVFINGVSQGKFAVPTGLELYGQDGNDDLELAPGTVVPSVLIAGGKGNDTLVGSDGPDLLEGDDGDDKLFGGAGNDTLLGGAGNDVLDGGTGVNQLDAGFGQDGVVVRGTAGNDRILIGRQVGSHGAQLVAEVNGRTSVENYTNGETVFVFADRGNDFVQMLPSAGGHWNGEFHGGDGNDSLFGGAKNDVLLGEAGDDLLFGGEGGRDVLIGGRGADTLLGGRNGSLLIGGTTAFDANEAALAAVLAEWSSGRGYEARGADLRGVGTGPRANGNDFLKAAGPHATVFDDGTADVLVGGPGGDWFIARRAGEASDTLIGRAGNEFVDDLAGFFPASLLAAVARG